MARQALALLFLAQVRCQEAEPHLNWLMDETDDDEDREELAVVLERCEERAAQPTPDPSLQLENDEAISTAVMILQEADVEIRYLDVEENEGQRTLVVAYAVDLAVDSEDYSNLERQLILELSRILPRMTSEPDGLVVVAGTFNRTTSATLVATRAAEVWLQGQLTEEEFENTWRRQEVESSDE